ncbi:MAG TPA: PD-(D/E)XK nuclease family protein [Actinobacteria bacterium]|nr:PD-(D/E)XK nuclease family protein [Actinomycetota bacterium]HDL50253.1 PD-(D/E)XK nuclease family protein [Actinomycetota bacterium]
MNMQASGLSVFRGHRSSFRDSRHVVSHPVAIVTTMSLQTLSPSRAGDFKTCPQLFKFRAIDRLPEPTTIYQARGTTAHLALERLYDLPAPERTAERLYELFRQAWTELRDNEEYLELFEDSDAERRWGMESMALLGNYFALEDPTEVSPLHRELNMLEQLDGMAIRGILDRIDETADGDLVILDYKTGKAPPERYAMGAFFALKIYALLVRKRTGRTPIEVRLLYLNGPTMYRLGIDDSKLDAVERAVRALWDRIDQAIAEERFPANPGPLCDWCSFKDRCPAWARSPET